MCCCIFANSRPCFPAKFVLWFSLLLFGYKRGKFLNGLFLWFFLLYCIGIPILLYPIENHGGLYAKDFISGADGEEDLSVINYKFFYHRMASNSRQGGIQQLLAAEHEAQAIVNAAKNGIVASLNLLFWHVVCHDMMSSHSWSIYVF